jgi:hypothetical protein
VLVIAVQPSWGKEVMTLVMKREHKTLIVRVYPELARALREQAVLERRTLSSVATFALEMYLKKSRSEEKEIVHAE